MRVAILAPGTSMSQAVADAARACDVVIAVSNVGIDTVAESGETIPALAPWADALVAQDAAWWREHPHALQFAGRKFSTNKIQGVERISTNCTSQTNTGALALEVARLHFKAKRIELHGFDLRGSHYFGKYTSAKLRNTSVPRFETFQQQFALMGVILKRYGIKVINRTPGSALRCFPIEA